VLEDEVKAREQAEEEMEGMKEVIEQLEGRIRQEK